jgi:phospholipid/cholesterol/gamma-HCH transport system permease protein
LTPPSARPVAAASPAQVEPRVAITTGKDATLVRADGIWLVHSLGQSGVLDRLNRQLALLRAKPLEAHWDLTAIARLDHFGAQYLWNFWGHARPANLKLGRRQEEFFDRLYHLGDVRLQPPEKVTFKTLRGLGQGIFNFAGHMVGFTGLIGQLMIDLGRLIRRPARGPWTEVSANIFHAGTQALGITALVGFLIGVVLSYLSAQQLRSFGADIYIVNILGMAIIRELGPTLAAILVAGRSGSAITAQLGVMRVTEELDAMLVMGIPHGFRLILPRVLALAIAMPLLVLWTDALAIFGGMVAAKLSLGMSLSYFFHALPDAVSLPNLWLGVGKGAVFGMLIALTACHFGLRIEPNTASLGEGTTSSVVTAITVVILADAVFAIVFKNVGV